MTAAAAVVCEPTGYEMPPMEVVFGQSPEMQSVRRKVEKVACANVPVLVRGESGTGKELVARMIHALSSWRSGPFVKVSCPAIPGSLLESELFGYEKGAFTGAYTSKPGRVEQAHLGTLFLDEIAELDSALQAKMLQVLQDGRFCHIGDHEEKQVDTRIICATSRRLEQDIEAGTFRQDLFYRINVISISLPPLRERREDVPLLADYFLAAFNRRYQRNASPISKGMRRVLQNREWPGNIRELENCIARYVLLGNEDALVSDLAGRQGPAAPTKINGGGAIPLKQIAKQAVRDMERDLILQVLQANRWNRRKAAEVLGISYRALLYKIRLAGLPQQGLRMQASGAEERRTCRGSAAD